MNTATFRSPSPVGMFDGLSEAYRSDGFDAGYRRAMNDAAADLLLSAERFARDHPESAGVVRRFARQFERHLDGDPAVGDARPDDYVSDGLGI